MKLVIAVLVVAVAGPALASTRQARSPPPGGRPSGSSTTTTTTTTTTTSSSSSSTDTGSLDTSNLSDYALEVLADAQEAIEAGSCGDSATSCSSSCYGDTESVYIEYVVGDYRYIIVNGIPDHTANQGAEEANPNDACEIRSYMKVPVNVTAGSYFANGMGAIGLAVTGAFIYNPLSNTLGVDDVAVLNEGASFDSCDGHADNTCSYHYHEGISCVSDDSDCPLVGHLRDGVPVYGYCTIDGTLLQSCYQQTTGDGYSSSDYEWVDSDDCHLDVNNGYTFSDGTYGYVLTDSFPYTSPGYMGVPMDVCTF